MAQTQKREAEGQGSIPALEPSKGTIVASSGTIPQYNIVYDSRIFTTYATTLKQKKLEFLRQIVAVSGTVFRSKNRAKIFLWFHENGAGCARQIHKETQINKTVIYRELEYLLLNNYIIAYQEVKIYKNPGKPPILYGLKGIDEETRLRAVESTLKCYRKSYDTVDKIVQLCLEEVKFEEIQYNKIIWLSRQYCRGFDFKDIADMAARELRRKHNVRIWR